MSSDKLEPVKRGGRADGQSSADDVPLCCDLDGTLVRTDLLHEACLLLLRHHPVKFIHSLDGLRRGKAGFKHLIAQETQLRYDLLPYNQSVLAFLHKEKAKGRKLVLATAAARSFAENIASHLGIFDEIFSSSEDLNLDGETKRAVLTKAFGEKRYDYIGNDRCDLYIWRSARICYSVCAVSWTLKQLEGCRHVVLEEANARRRFHVLLRAMRVHQWTKNLLIFVPIVTSHQIAHLALLAEGLVAFISFSFVASAVYILNDLHDLEADREHATKRKRPLAAGDLSIFGALVTMGVLLSLGAITCLLLRGSFAVLLMLYILVTTAYSYYLKRKLLADVGVLAGLYTLRIVAGSVATMIPLSFWLLSFSLFFFYSLACSKRYIELSHRVVSDQALPGRAYLLTDAQAVASLGMGTAVVSSAMVALYVQSSVVTHLYRGPMWLLLLCPVILFWLGRIWILAHRRHLPTDPVVFAAMDRVTYFCAAVSVIILLIAKFCPMPLPIIP